MSKLKIYKGQYGFQIGCYGKDLGGNESKYYMGVQFKKGMEPKDSCEITVKDFFFSAYTKRDGHTAPKLIVTDYELVSAIANTNKQEKVFDEPIISQNNEICDDTQLTLSPDDLPFY